MRDEYRHLNHHPPVLLLTSPYSMEFVYHIEERYGGFQTWI